MSGNNYGFLFKTGILSIHQGFVVSSLSSQEDSLRHFKISQESIILSDQCKKNAHKGLGLLKCLLFLSCI